MAYQFALIDPSRPASELFGDHVLGIEITVPALARACGLGNIDPQHGCGGGVGKAAIDSALEWPLPEPGALLVTIRPDADALGAMAVLSMRATGTLITSAVRRRVMLVATHDAFEHGPWMTWAQSCGPLPRLATAVDMTGAPLAYRAIAAIAQKRELALDQRVDAICRWLEAGVLPAAALCAARHHAETLAEAWNDGRLQITPQLGGRIALVRSTVLGGLQLGYRVAPVVVAEAGSGGARKVTISQFNPGWLRLTEVRDRLTQMEPGWGGSATILGSPMFGGSSLPLTDILEVIESALEPAALSELVARRGFHSQS